MAIIIEATCSSCSAVVDPREYGENIIKKDLESRQDTLTHADPKAVVLETHWTPYTPCPSCGEIGWTNLKFTRHLHDKGDLGDVTEE